jgi:isoleucyl-tRNA synthetase
MSKFKNIPSNLNFPNLEEEIISFWKENNIFEKSVDQRPDDNVYTFYDGPPFITGLPHHGSLLPSIAKDVIPRYWTMKGKKVKRVWGWDCHGIPLDEKTERGL